MLRRNILRQHFKPLMVGVSVNIGLNWEAICEGEWLQSNPGTDYLESRPEPTPRNPLHRGNTPNEIINPILPNPFKHTDQPDPFRHTNQLEDEPNAITDIARRLKRIAKEDNGESDTDPTLYDEPPYKLINGDESTFPPKGVYLSAI